MARISTKPDTRIVQSGDYGPNMSKKKGGKMVDTRKKQLINLPDDQKAWIMRVVELANERGQDCNQTVVIRALVGKAMSQEPESFVIGLEKLTLKAKLDDIERRAAALAAEKAKLTEALGQDGRQDGRPEMAGVQS